MGSNELPEKIGFNENDGGFGHTFYGHSILTGSKQYQALLVVDSDDWRKAFNNCGTYVKLLKAFQRHQLVQIVIGQAGASDEDNLDFGAALESKIERVGRESFLGRCQLAQVVRGLQLKHQDDVIHRPISDLFSHVENLSRAPVQPEHVERLVMLDPAHVGMVVKEEGKTLYSDPGLQDVDGHQPLAQGNPGATGETESLQAQVGDPRLAGIELRQVRAILADNTFS